MCVLIQIGSIRWFVLMRLVDPKKRYFNKNFKETEMFLG